ADAAVRAGRRKLEPAKLQERERRVTDALGEAASQSQFKERVLRAAAEKGRRDLIPIDQEGASKVHVDTVLEPSIEKLQLERTTRSDASFALRVKARIRLLQAADSTVLYDEPFEFRSGMALFND